MEPRLLAVLKKCQSAQTDPLREPPTLREPPSGAASPDRGRKRLAVIDAAAGFLKELQIATEVGLILPRAAGDKSDR